jgi:hypothetical protein
LSLRLKEIGGRISEAQKDDKGVKKYPVVIISQGLGNLADCNYYTAQAIKQAAADKIYEGKKVYFDHPTPSQEKEQPGRSVREAAGHYEDVRAEKDKDGMMILRGMLVPEQQNAEMMGKLDHAIYYKNKYPDQDYVGISINGDGEGTAMDYDEFIKEYKPSTLEMEKLSQIEGKQINAITKLTSAVSADLVTEAGAKGRLLLESNKKRRRTMLFIEGFKKLFSALERNNSKMAEDAVKGMLQSEDEDEKKKQEAMEDEACSKEAEGLAKGLLNAKKEGKKYEGESESEYEARMMKQAVKAMKASKKEEDEKSKEGKSEDEDEKKEGKDKEDFPPKKDAKKKDDDSDGDDDAKEGDKKDDDSKEAAKDDDGDDSDHKDKKQDVALIKKMMKQMDEMKKEIEGLKKEKKESEDEAKKHHESAASAQVKLLAKERVEYIDRVLAESGMRRQVTDIIRPVLEKCKSKEEIKETAKKLTEAHSKAIESVFYEQGQIGFPEMTNGDKSASNDSLFL